MKGRCCPKIVVSIPRSLFTSGQLRHIGGIVPKTALPLWRKVCKKRVVDITSRYKWWINEELHRWSFNKPLKIAYHWYLKYLLTQTFFLVIAQWRFHSTWSTISFPKIRLKKISIGIYFHILMQYKPIIGRISACHGIWIRKLSFSVKIAYHWYLKYLLTQTFFLVIAQWRFHSTWSTISFPKIRRRKKYQSEFISTFWCNISLSLEELVPVMVSE